MLTQERANVLTEILNADEARAKSLLTLEPTEAAAQINVLGNDFTADELIAYGESLKTNGSQGELDAEALDNVAGGSFTAAAIAGAFLIGRAW